MNCVLTNQEPMALISYMETNFKHTTPDLPLFSEEKFEIAVHKEIFLPNAAYAHNDQKY